jgi:AcrR family transcriptional regulator
MAAQGYVDTSVADVIKSAGVSRQTFYELFTSKQDCFLAGYSARQEQLIGVILANPAAQSALQRFDSLLQTYLSVMTHDPAVSRLYLIGVYAAGDEAVAKRLELQQQFVDGVADVFGARSAQDHFACRALVAAISTLMTNALLSDDPQAVPALHGPLLELARQLMTPR